MNDSEILRKIYQITKVVETKGKAAITEEVTETFRNYLYLLDSEYKELYLSLKDKINNLLLIGDAYSIFLQKFSRNLKLFFGKNLKIIAFSPIWTINYYSLGNKEIVHFYDFLYLWDLRFRRKAERSIIFKFVNFFVKPFEIRKQFEKVIKIHKIDLIHIHFLNYYWYYILNYFIEYPTITTLWGGDIYIIPQLRYKGKFFKALQEKILQTSKLITVGNEYLKFDILKIFNSNLKEKIRIATYGTPIDLVIYDLISEEDIKSFKNKYRIPESKVLITISSSADPQENHINILQAVQQIYEKYHNVHLLVPMTYGNLQYRNYIKKILQSKNLSFTFFENYLSDKEVAILKKVSDITILIPTTDSFSAFLIESLYAGSVVVTGKWLPYKWIEERKLYVWKISKPTPLEIKSVLEKILENLNEEKIKSRGNRMKILRFIAWQYRFKDWLKIYLEAINQ